MKKSVKLLMSISLCMCMIMTLFSFNIHAADNDNVQLYYADIGGYYGNGGYWATGKIAVKDLGENKNVVVHYTTDGDTWFDVSATYLKKSTDGYDIYTFKTPMVEWNGFYYYKYNWTFAIKYEVNGNTYWDNNYGQNYSVNISNFEYCQNIVLGKCKLLSESSYKDVNNIFRGNVMVKDYNPNKIVTIRYTTDSWKTHKDVRAYKSSYQPYSDMELWTFDINEDAGVYEYAIKCEINGQTYWDNNFGDNYIYTHPF
ncbi:carbohydrate-binding protein [Vallitalea guaymasensis]|uniref:CBM21 domain-containing protein n=1 Tax=Vallitalea guaymasensis TaxID=1185412 RepID=A0A8J8SBN2_9FIRM|nr:carbohydrate-binding protein [Vallitalea guaymasensis]QUH28585.1 hypothetical protein HYG85_06490 [Vallitalea guaymasensis]